jgi:catechol 2,3-dioxygenase-like lactoylglutathione lyase family enzyme
MPTTLPEVAAPSAATSPLSAETTTLFHLGLYVADLERSLAFYRLLFEREPSKLHAGDYAEFEVLDPPLLLALTQNPARRPGGVLNHVGLRYADESRVAAVGQRLEAAGLEVRREEQTVCCYGRQTKVWVTDPDHNLWEIYVLFEDVSYSGFGGGKSRPPVEPATASTAPAYTVVYRGPFGELTADDGTVYRRGEAVSVSAAVWEELRRGPAADQFALLSELHA